MIKKRLNYIDIAKAFAIFYIVIGHTIVHSQNSNLILRFVCSFHVVLFFVLSGYTFKVHEPFKQFTKKKFTRIMIPYFLWAVLFLVPYYLLGAKVGEQLGTTQYFNIWSVLKNILYANGNAAALKQNSSLWFLPALFTIEIIYYGIISFTNNSRKKEIITLLIILIVGYFSANYFKYILPWGINTMVNVGGFFYIGYLLNKYCILDKINIYFQIIITLIIGLISCFYGNEKHLSYIDFYYGNYWYMILSGIFLSIFTICISKLINKSKVLEYVGRNTMGILIFHKLFVIIFQTKCGAISNLVMNSNFFVETLLAITISILAIALSILITIPIRKITPFAIGENKQSV